MILNFGDWIGLYYMYWGLQIGLCIGLLDYPLGIMDRIMYWVRIGSCIGLCIGDYGLDCVLYLLYACSLAAFASFSFKYFLPFHFISFHF